MLTDEYLRDFHLQDHKQLEAWLSKFPDPKLEEHPRLLLAKGQILTNNENRLEEALVIFHTAEEKFQANGNLVGVARAWVWQSVCRRMQGKAGEAIRLAEQGFDQLYELVSQNERLILVPQSEWLIAWATLNRGLAYDCRGDITRALADIFEALVTFDELDDEFMTALCHHDIGALREKQGYVVRAMRHYKKAEKIWLKLKKWNDLANS